MIAAHDGNDEAEGRRLHQAGHYVLGFKEVEGALQVGSGIESKLVHTDEIATENADDVADQHQEGKAYDAGQYARYDEVFEWVGRQGGQCVDLFGDPHGADFGGHRGADPAGNHETCQHRPELAGHGKDDDGRDRAFGIKAGEPGIALQGQHHAGEKRGQSDNRQGIVADIHQLAAKQAPVDRRAHAVAERDAGEHRQTPGCGKKAEKGPSDSCEESHACGFPAWDAGISVGMIRSLRSPPQCSVGYSDDRDLSISHTRLCRLHRPHRSQCSAVQAGRQTRRDEFRPGRHR